MSSGLFRRLRHIFKQPSPPFQHESGEYEHQTHLHFLNSLDQVNRAIMGTDDLEQMMSDVLDAVLSVFDCDRASLVYPCGPVTPTWSAPMERTRPEYPGVLTLNMDVPFNPDVVRVHEALLASKDPLGFGPGNELPLPPDIVEKFSLQSQLATAIYPKVDHPYMFVIHQCSRPRIWTAEERELFKQIGRRVADGLSSLLVLHNLRSSEEKYRRLFETAREGIWEQDENLHTAFVNARIAEMLGYDEDELRDRPVTDFMFEEDIPDHLLKTEHRKKGLPEVYERRFVKKDGTTLWTILSATPLFDGDRFKGSFAMISDITERKQAEETLKQLNRELRAISLCNQALIRVEDETTLLNEVCNIICNEAGYLLAWVGYVEQDTEKTIRPVAWTGDDSGYVANARLSWSEDVPHGQGPAGIAVRSGKYYYVQDFTVDAHMAPWRGAALQRGYHSGIALPLKDENDTVFGVLLIYSAKVNAITPDEIRLLEELAGDLAFGIVTLRNRAERKQSEQQLMLLNFALNNVRDEALLVDENAHINYANDEICHALKYSREELLKLTIPDIDATLAKEQWEDAWRTVKERGSLTTEGIHRTSDHSEYPVEISASYFEYEQQGYILALSRDISERKRAEKEMLRINRFLHTLSRCNETLVHARDEQDLLHEMCRVVVEVGEFALAWVGYTDDTHSLRVQAQFGGVVEGYVETTIPIDTGSMEQICRPAVRALQSGEIQVVQDTASDVCQHWKTVALEYGYHSAIALPLRIGDEVIGVFSIYFAETDGFGGEETALLSELANDLSYGIHALRARTEREHFIRRLQGSMESTIQALASTVDLRDPYTAGHQRRVATLAAAIARSAGLTEEQIQIIYLSGLVHDIGKIAIPAEILSKPGRLSETEMSLARTHVTASYDILKNIDFPWPIARIVRQHHERMDGSGYPDGLAGKGILVEARVLAVADVVEAMNTHRPYRPALGIDAALEELQKGRGILYDAEFVELCIKLFHEEGFVFD